MLDTVVLIMKGDCQHFSLLLMISYPLVSYIAVGCVRVMGHKSLISVCNVLFLMLRYQCFPLSLPPCAVCLIRLAFRSCYTTLLYPVISFLVNLLFMNRALSYVRLFSKTFYTFPCHVMYEETSRMH